VSFKSSKRKTLYPDDVVIPRLSQTMKDGQCYWFARARGVKATSSLSRFDAIAKLAEKLGGEVRCGTMILGKQPADERQAAPIETVATK